MSIAPVPLVVALTARCAATMEEPAPDVTVTDPLPLEVPATPVDVAFSAAVMLTVTFPPAERARTPLAGAVAWPIAPPTLTVTAAPPFELALIPVPTPLIVPPEPVRISMLPAPLVLELMPIPLAPPLIADVTPAPSPITTEPPPVLA